MKFVWQSTLLLLAASFLTMRDVTGFPASTSPSSSKSLSSNSDTTIPMEIDVAKAFNESTFPIAPDDLIGRAKKVLSPEVGIGTKDNGVCLADDFQFCAAVVGPLPKEEYLNALGTFKLEDSFDITQNAFGFTVSPIQPNRVYWFTNTVAKMKADFAGAKVEKVTKEKGDLIFPPQVFHMDFTPGGLVKEFGFYTADRQYGNTGGLGGAFGFFYGVGKPLPIPEAKPFKRSLRFKLFNLVGRMAQKFQKKK